MQQHIDLIHQNGRALAMRMCNPAHHYVNDGDDINRVMPVNRENLQGLECSISLKHRSPIDVHSESSDALNFYSGMMCK